MVKKSLLPRGFKAKAEKIAVLCRKELDLKPFEPLCGFALAKHLNIEVCIPMDFFPKNTNLDDLIGSSNKDNGWSALTMVTRKGNKLIIHNNLHSLARQQSNLMHEIAHILCDHKYNEAPDDLKLLSLMRDHNPQQEEEATYLGSALQIPREGLIWSLKQGKNYSEISDYYTASMTMVTFRINSTGVKRQLSYLDL